LTSGDLGCALPQASPGGYFQNVQAMVALLARGLSTFLDFLGFPSQRLLRNVLEILKTILSFAQFKNMITAADYSSGAVHFLSLL
jgi:hypothetical protein